MTAVFRMILPLFLLMALPTLAAAEVIDGIAAVVNGDLITTYDLEKETSLMMKEAAKKPGPVIEKGPLRPTALNQLIDKKLAEQKIRELDIKISDEEVRQAIEEVKKQNNLTEETLVAALLAQGMTFDQYKTQLRQQLERLRLMGQEVRSKVQVGEKDVREYYQANQKQFGEEIHEARHIYFKVDEKTPAADVKRIMSTAMSVLQEARSGNDFAELAKKYSDDQLTSREGGYLGTFKKGEMLPEIEKTVEKMNPGEISDLVITPAGFHIIKLEKRSVKEVKSYDQVKGEIEELLYRKKSEERFNQWTADLRKGAAIEIK